MLPLVVLADRDAEYRQAQASADAGKTQAFVSLIEEMVVDLLQLLAVRIRHSGPNSDASSTLAERLNAIGDDPDNRIAAAHRLNKLLDEPLRRALDALDLPAGVECRVGHGSGGRPVEGHTRVGSSVMVNLIIETLSQPNRLHLILNTASAIDPLEPQPVLLTADLAQVRDQLHCRVNEIYPRPSQAFRMRLEAWIDEQVAQIPGAVLEYLDR